MTNQFISDTMLIEDQAARRAAKRGDFEAAADHYIEVDKLARLLR